MKITIETEVPDEWYEKMTNAAYTNEEGKPQRIPIKLRGFFQVNETGFQGMRLVDCGLAMNSWYFAKGILYRAQISEEER